MLAAENPIPFVPMYHISLIFPVFRQKNSSIM